MSGRAQFGVACQCQEARRRFPTFVTPFRRFGPAQAGTPATIEIQLVREHAFHVRAEWFFATDCYNRTKE